METVLPPPAGRPTFRERFLDLGASTGEAPAEAGPAPGDTTPAPGGGATAPGEAPLRSGAKDEAETGGMRPTDADLAHVTDLLADLVADLQERGEAALDIQDGLPSFQVTLRAYCRGYLDGRRGAREG